MITSIRSAGARGALCLVPLLTGLVGCAGASDTAASPGTTDDGTAVSQEDGAPVEGDEDAPPVIVDVTSTDIGEGEDAERLDPTLAECVTETSYMEPYPSSRVFHRWTFDASELILSRLPSDVRGNVGELPSATDVSLFWRFDAQGRVVTRAGEGAGYTPFRQDAQLDEQGNLTRYDAVYQAALEIEGAISGRSYSYAVFENTYDESGHIERHEVVESDNSSSVAYVYTHDGDGRCQTMTIERGEGESSETLRYGYDAEGRLAQRALEGTPNQFPEYQDRVTSYEYDAEGRLARATDDYGDSSAPRVRLSLDYAADGGLRESRFDPSDTGNRVWQRKWSAGCREIWPLLVRVPSGACVVDYRDPGDFYMP